MTKPLLGNEPGFLVCGFDDPRYIRNMTPKIAIPQARIEEFCRRHHIRRLALFGSVLRDDFTPESDVDVLVEFEEGMTPGFEFVSMQEELSEILGRKVDLNTAGFLSDYFRDEVMQEAQSLYVKA